jgi:hypothetical protein
MNELFTSEGWGLALFTVCGSLIISIVVLFAWKIWIMRVFKRTLKAAIHDVKSQLSDVNIKGD